MTFAPEVANHFSKSNIAIIRHSYRFQDFELLEVSVLRQMLKQHFRKLSDSGEAAVEVAVEDSGAGGPAILRKKTIRNFDLERIIDDFVFM